MTSDDLVISVENLFKRYFVGHESARREHYNSLRDTVVRHARNLGRNVIDMARGRQIIQGDEIEEFWALKDVSFDVKRGEVIGIVGRNGAGKSTLLKILSRITEPTQGRVKIRGRVASLLEVGTGFHPELTGRENIFLNGAILGMAKSEIKAKFDEIVDFAEVEKFLDTPVKRYSSGMYVRLAFAIAAHLEPEILIVDEVLAVGDIEFQKKCLGKMQDVATDDSRTVLFVSHNMAAIESLCDRALLLVGGRCIAHGETGEIVQEYLHDLNQQSAVPLHERKDRKGTGDIRVALVLLEGPEGNGVSAFQCGADATFHFVMENHTQRVIPNLQLALGIDNELGQRVALLDTLLLGVDLPSMLPGEASVRVIMPKLALAPGRYRLTIFSTINGTIVDWVRNAIAFDVEAGDFFGTGRLPPLGEGMFLIDHRFVNGRPMSIG